ncbi:MAG: hypothetical protein QG652_1762, partial [Pseudomonadota bacterium]|nr:hypothetical protein [Pseudomonadota bacterium]
KTQMNANIESVYLHYIFYLFADMVQLEKDAPLNQTQTVNT